MLVLNVAVQVIKPLASGILVGVVVWIELLLGPVNSTVTKQAPPASVLYFSKLSGDERIRYDSVGVNLHVLADVASCLLLVWGEQFVHQRGSRCVNRVTGAKIAG
jgi:hypothetical protein